MMRRRMAMMYSRTVTNSQNMSSQSEVQSGNSSPTAAPSPVRMVSMSTVPSPGVGMKDGGNQQPNMNVIQAVKQVI